MSRATSNVVIRLKNVLLLHGKATEADTFLYMRTEQAAAMILFLHSFPTSSYPFYLRLICC